MSYRDNNVTKYVALIFIKEFSHVLCSLLPSSWSFPDPVFLAQTFRSDADLRIISHDF